MDSVVLGLDSREEWDVERGRDTEQDSAGCEFLPLSLLWIPSLTL
jgi:hypothetical protein